MSFYLDSTLSIHSKEKISYVYENFMYFYEFH